MIDGDLVLAVERIKDGVAYTYGYGLLLKVETDTYVGMSLRAALVRACSMFSAYDMDETWRDAFIDDLVPEEKWPSSG